MMALAIGGDTISNEERREAIIDGLFDLPSKFFKSNLMLKRNSDLWFFLS